MRKLVLIILLFISFESFAQTPLHLLIAKKAGNGCIATDPDVCIFLAATGITDPTISSAIDDLVIAAKAHGWWTKELAIYPFVGGTSATHAVNLKSPGTFDITFNGSYTHNSNGITGDGSTAYANTNINALSSLSSTDLHFSIWSATNSAADICDIGVSNAATSEAMLIYTRQSSGNAVAWAPSNTSALTISVANSTGYYDAVRTGASSFELYKNGSSIGSNSSSSGALTNSTIMISALNYNGGPIQLTNRNYKFADIGTSYNSTVASDKYNDIAAFQTALGR